GLGIERAQQSWQIVQIAADAHNHMILHHQRRHGGPVALLHVRDDLVPAHRAIFGVQRNEMRIRRYEIKPAFVHTYTAMTDVVALGSWVFEVPDHVAGPRIKGPDIVGHCEVEDSIHEPWRRFCTFSGVICVSLLWRLPE